MVDVYHECSDPETVLNSFKATKPAADSCWSSFAEDPDTDQARTQMTLDQVRREVEPQGFVFQQSLVPPRQHIIIFEPAKPTKTPAARKRWQNVSAKTQSSDAVLLEETGEDDPSILKPPVRVRHLAVAPTPAS
jgi:hypothetical protein